MRLTRCSASAEVVSSKHLKQRSLILLWLMVRPKDTYKAKYRHFPPSHHLSHNSNVGCGKLKNHVHHEANKKRPTTNVQRSSLHVSTTNDRIRISNSTTTAKSYNPDDNLCSTTSATLERLAKFRCRGPYNTWSVGRFGGRNVSWKNEWQAAQCKCQKMYINCVVPPSVHFHCAFHCFRSGISRSTGDGRQHLPIHRHLHEFVSLASN